MDLGNLQENESCRFRGIIDDPFKLPGFLTPAFSQGKHTNQLLLQNISPEERVLEFYPCYHIASSEESCFFELGSFPVSSDSAAHRMETMYSRSIGDPALFAVRFPDQDVVICIASELRMLLEDRLHEFSRYPSIQLELARFTGDDRLEREAFLRANQRDELRAESENRMRDLEKLLAHTLKANKSDLRELTSLISMETDAILGPSFTRLIRNMKDNLELIELRRSISAFFEDTQIELQSTRLFASFTRLAGIAGCTNILPQIKAFVTCHSSDDEVHHVLEALGAFGDQLAHKFAQQLIQSGKAPTLLPQLLSLIVPGAEYPALFEHYQKIFVEDNNLKEFLHSYPDESQYVA